MSQARKILVTGASGYVGGRLVTALLADGVDVRVFVRDANKVQSHSWAKQVEIATGNASDFESTKAALTGVHTAY
ncbi:MAG: NAD(P)H-binding protein, partial [Candidatus Nanopelagicus sp.]